MAETLHLGAPVLVIGNGPIAPGALALARRHAPHLVAADGGADAALAMGLMPQAVIGDLDSLSCADEWRARGVQVIGIAEQTTTDFEKCLYTIRAPILLAVGFSGGRIDHDLAVCAALMGHAGAPVVVIGQRDILFRLPDPARLDLPAGMRVSLFPMRAVSAARSVGLEWPLDGLHLAPDGRIATSNRATGPVGVTGGAGLLAILPHAALPAALAALTG